MTDAAAAPPRVRVWDLPTRVFHWVLALAVVGLVVTGKTGGNAMAWHFRLGYLVLGLLAFRLLWGLVGGRWSRFSSFFYTPRSTWRYLRGASRDGDVFDVGHSPTGALSVLALLAVLALQVASGLVSFDDVVQVGGPLNRFVTEGTAASALTYHKAVGQWLVIGLVVLHLAAVLFYLVGRKHNLVAPMWHGNKRLADPTLAAADSTSTRALALAIGVVAAALVGWVVSLGA